MSTFRSLLCIAMVGLLILCAVNFSAFDVKKIEEEKAPLRQWAPRSLETYLSPALGEDGNPVLNAAFNLAGTIASQLGLEKIDAEDVDSSEVEVWVEPRSAFAFCENTVGAMGILDDEGMALYQEVMDTLCQGMGEVEEQAIILLDRLNASICGAAEEN